jgi:hypothetical protein
MPRVRNAFKIRAADAPIIETSQFLQLYCPLLLDQLQHDDLFVPKLIVVRGSPGSGKSSLLRLFETDTLLALHGRKSQSSDQDLVERLSELGILSERGPKIIGIYIQCDSSLRDIANLSQEQGTLRLFNTLLDTRIVVSFLRALRRLAASSCVQLAHDCVLEPLPSGDAPPVVFSEARSVDQMEQLCTIVERDFGTLLNSFPDDPLPTSIQPHARVYSLSYLALQMQRNPALSELMPVVMLDDVQELYPEQRIHLKDEFIRRAAIPRWLAVRTHVFGLEELISLEGADDGREYREIPLDEIFQERPAVFGKFSTNVVHRRLQATESLQEVTASDFRDLLRSADERVPSDLASKGLTGMIKRASELPIGHAFAERLKQTLEVAKHTLPTFSELMDAEKSLVLLERQANRGQGSLFPGMEIPETTDAKTAEAARLFITQRLHGPYYFGFDTLTNVASGNVEQLLSTAAVIVDRMIYRAELDREQAISAKEQEEILKRCAEAYYGALEEKHRRGSAIRQFVDNLGIFCGEVTYRPNAPIAPGVNGFGLTRQEILEAVSNDKIGQDSITFREVLTNAVAGNVLSVRVTKQGQAGSEKIVFYLNRLLCAKFRLPLNYGGWQHLPVKLLIRMMQGPVPLREMTRRGGGTSGALLWPEGT